MENEEKKKGSKVGVILSIILIIAAGLGGWFVGKINTDKVEKEKIECQKELKQEKTKAEEVKEETPEETQSTTEKTTVVNSAVDTKCVGTYYVNGSATEKYILKEDGTYRVEGQEEAGVFFTKDNTITFIKMKHTVGPKEEDPYYYDPQTYLKSDDCQTIRLTEAGSHTSAELKKAN